MYATVCNNFPTLKLASNSFRFYEITPINGSKNPYYLSLRKTVGKVSPIPVTLTSRSDSDVENSNVSFKGNKPDGVNPNSNDIHYYVGKNEGKIQWFSAD